MPFKKTIGFVAICAAAVATLAGCRTIADSDPNVLTLGVTAEAGSFDPVGLKSSPGTAVQFWAPVYDTLLRREPGGEVQPNMADWSYDADRTALTLNLRDGLRFADGSPITADQVVASMDRFRNGGGPDAGNLAGITAITATTDKTVILDLSEPDPSLLYKLTSTSGAIANPAEFDKSNVALDPAESGAYVLDNGRTTPGVEYTYVRNPYYWNPGAWPFEEISLKILLDPTARINALRSGQVDATLIDAQSVAEMKTLGFQVTTQSSAWEGMILFDRNGELTPALADRRVRQAMNLAFDREAIARYLMLGTVEPNSQMFRDGSSAYYDGHSYPYDLERARQLMAEAGYEDGFDLVMPSVSVVSYLEPIIIDSLSEIGIRARFEAVPADQVNSLLFSRKYSATETRYSQDAAWLDFSRHILPDAPFNPFHIETPELDALLKTAQYATPEERTAAEKAVGQYLFDNAWYVPLFNSSQLIGHIDGIQVTPQLGVNILPLQNYAPAAPAPAD
ncbi:hypothetical protein JWS13_14845 [Rhodococcus pseudokoreensis]|uniref:Solute-binding protein family 5 domain-containing protein n=1 Tax=Rhodococcus pseudokoreensis TaxID=2811421 RepID=A0A974W374_9NOCA|nr:ABC transporter substrate-binding protein [Rhodococcus pseudokoreensis]QSE89812.1 hypothetical protein JWS13_14845 [Rhodococcus pseudokoreensis]